VAFLAILVDRQAISLHALALAAMGVLLLQPEAVTEPGFQMSFAATAALVALAEIWPRPVREIDVPWPIRWVQADCRTLDLGERFDVVTLTGNAFQEFRTRADQEGLLSSVVRHLTPRGLFAFETRFPRPSALFAPETPPGEWSQEVSWRTFVNDAGQTVTVSTSQRHDPLLQEVEYVIFQRWEEAGGPQVRTERALLRFVYPREMEALLHYNGLTVHAAYGDWDRQPLTGTSPRMIYVCRLRA